MRVRHPKITIADAKGREWRVFDYQIIAGVLSRTDFGNGQYRGFAPVDGGARRTVLMFEKDRKRGTSVAVLLDQLAHSDLHRKDDPVAQATYGKQPERVDP